MRAPLVCETGFVSQTRGTRRQREENLQTF